MIQARNLRKKYGGVAAVDDLSFDVRPGVVTGFLGPNGAGKSTTIRLMLGLDRGEGETLFDGVPYRKLRQPLREVGYVSDVRALHPGRKARTHLRMLAASQGIGRKRVDEVLDWVGLTTVARKRPRAYSLGMVQRLGLAAALLGDPRVLILDEPANGLDPAGIQWLRGFLRAYAAEGRTVFVSSHQLAEMSQMADHLVVIGQGRLIADEPADVFAGRSSTAGRVLVRTPHVERLRRLLAEVGADVERGENSELAVGGVDRAIIGELAFRNGIVLHELTLRSAPLEDAFLELTAPRSQFTARAVVPAHAAGPRIPAQATSSGPADWDTQTFDVVGEFERDGAAAADSASDSESDTESDTESAIEADGAAAGSAAGKG
ncbi:ABC transporter ATP-binding protein [Sporichthya polymorpha]|uniref:ABC transporter ATP-binding protein n=1 Tax=Sporichthya polymorpha TaxID=35751 RepID=UPI00036EA846|nr:ATP-binding cassette domain-containing protein [Sporichthya polymorpha]